MNAQKKTRIIKIVVLMLIIIPPTVYIYYCLLIYEPLFTRGRHGWYGPPVPAHTKLYDQFRNAEIVDFKHNMILILTLPNHHKSQSLTKDDRVGWITRSNSKAGAKFYSNYGHVVEVHLHKNSFVVVDGVTGEELIVHPITKKEVQQWIDGFRSNERRHFPPGSNLVEQCFIFFSIPEAKFLEIQEKVNQHDSSNERERGDGFSSYGDDVTIFHLERKNKTEETNEPLANIE